MNVYMVYGVDKTQNKTVEADFFHVDEHGITFYRAAGEDEEHDESIAFFPAYHTTGVVKEPE